jgi:chromosome segregation ATPase
VVGAAPVFFDQRLALFPLFVMAFYLIFGLKEAKSQGFELEFADSFYYLGFTLTIASLLASLDPLHPKAEADPKIVLHFFGLGMFTTLFGVTGRTVLQMFYRTSDENVETTNRRIADAAQEFLRRLGELAAQADDALAGTLRALDGHIHRRIDETGAALGEIVGQLNRAASELAGFHVDGSRIDAALGELTQTLGEASRRTQKDLAIAGQASEQLARITESARDATQEAVNSVGQAVSQLASHVNSAATATDVLTQQLARLGSAPEHLDNSVAVVGQAFDSLAKRLVEQFDATASGTSLVSRSLADFSKQMSGLSVASIRSELSGLELGLAGLRSALEADGRKPDARVLSDLTAALEQSLAGAKRLNEVLDEIVEAIKIKLDNVR